MRYPDERTNVYANEARVLMRYLLAIGMLALSGCATAPIAPVVPQVVHDVVKVYVPVPAAFTAPCPIAELTTGTGFDGINVGHARKVSLLDCNDRMDKIRKLNGPIRKP